MKSFRILISALLIGFLSCCAGQMSRAPLLLKDGIKTATPESKNLAVNSFSSISEKVFDSRKSTKFNNSSHVMFQGVDSVLIMYQDELVYERYFNEGSRSKPHLMASLGKSLLSAIMGIAIDQGHIIDVEQSIYSLLPFRQYLNFDTNKKNIKLKHLLTMSSGWQCGGVENYADHCGVTMMEKQNPIKWVLDLPMEWQPGMRFNYNDAALRVASAILSLQTGQLSTDFGKQYLLSPLNIPGNVFRSGKLTSRDMIKIGQLFLRQGKYQGQQLISADWVKQSTSIQFAFKNDSKTKGYGYYWWIRDFHVSGKAYPSFYAAGNGGQYLFVVPQLQLVIATTGSNYDQIARTQKFIELVEKHILPPVVKAVE